MESLERKPRILIMDDEPMLRAILSRVLDRMHYQTVVAADSQQAIGLYREALAQQQRFDAVILDLVVNNGPGALETLAILRQLDPTVKAILSSGLVADDQLAYYQNYGFAAVLLKPFNTEQLQKTLTVALQG